MDPSKNWFPVKKAFEPDGESIVEEDEKSSMRFLKARPGDHLMTNFQCDLCHFRNILKRNPSIDLLPKDGILMTCIRRANLDCLWSKETGTVMANQREASRIIRKCKELGLSNSEIFPQKPIFPLKDIQLMGLAASMVHRSLDPGRNDKFVQFNTVRSMRSCAHNYWKASVNHEQTSVSVKGTTKLISSDAPTNSEWFEKFMKGYHLRVGDVCKPDLAISNELMNALMNEFESDWLNSLGNREKEAKVLFPAVFSIISYCASLRGEEATLLDLKSSRENTQFGLAHPSKPHVVITLTGRFKNETGILCHNIPLVETTSSGLKIRVWLERLFDWYGPNRNGYAFRDENGRKIKTGHYAPDILQHLKNIQDSGKPEHKGLIGADVDVFEEFGLSRSFRRGSDSRAIEMGLDVLTIELINRWRSTEKSKGKAASFRMIHRYADVRLILGRYLLYSESM